MAGEKLERAGVGSLGIEGDRVVHVENAKGRVITSRSHPWLEREEQARLEATIKDRRNIPINIFGNNKTRMTETRRRYEMLFGLLLNSGLRISEALGLKASDVRLVEGMAKSVRG